ncbi:MAG: GNAT family N-acetyltransferase [Candidatus Kariarchaeaceae archaeon]|jgi:predicted acetyltransferase
MTNIEIRESQSEEEFDQASLQTHYAFAKSPNLEELEKNKKFRKYNKENYNVILYEDGRPQATATAVPMTMNVRGVVFNMSGIAGVASYPEARRRGYVRQLMQHTFDIMKELNQTISCLYPFRESFYARLGYVTFPHAQVAEVAPANLKNLLKKDMHGTVERFLISEKLDEFRSFVKAMVTQKHGYCKFTDLQMGRLVERPSWLAIASTEGQNVGMLLYRITGFEGTLEISKFYYKNSLGKYLLLQWLGKHVDQVSKITLPLPPNEYMENWDLDLKVKKTSRKWVPSAMGRVVLIEGLAGMDVGKGQVTLEITDDNCPWNCGIWEFKAIDGKLTISKAESSEGTLTIMGLSAIIFGSHQLSDFSYLEMGELTEKVRKKIEDLFPTLIPYLNEEF